MATQVREKLCHSPCHKVVEFMSILLNHKFFLFVLSGSGKSYMAKMLRDVEVENGGDAPRIHSMDDYFMTEVEKVFNCLFLFGLQNNLLVIL